MPTSKIITESGNLFWQKLDGYTGWPSTKGGVLVHVQESGSHSCGARATILRSADNLRIRRNPPGFGAGVEITSYKPTSES